MPALLTTHADAPAGAYVPAAHALHADAPEKPLDVPAKHNEHDDAPDTL